MQRVGPYILGRTLGVGSTGKVKIGSHEETGDRVAIKIVNKDFLQSRPSLGKKIQREIAVLKLVNFPHVLRLFDVYETSKHLFLVLEYVSGGELFDYLVSRGRLDPPEALLFFQQIIAGVDCCHQHLVCHRDLKPENLLLDASKQVKIADFGMATLIKPGQMLATSCGSPHYASPEVVMGIQYDGRPADIWSCGVILFALLTGKLPFDDNNIRKLLTKVKEGHFSIPSSVSADAADLIRSMMMVDPHRRITIEKIKDHSWFCSNGAIMPNCFTPFDQNTLLKPIKHLKDEVLSSLVALGFGETRTEVTSALTTSTATLEKVFYYLFDSRRNEDDMDMDEDGLLFGEAVPDSPHGSPLLGDASMGLFPDSAGTPVPSSFLTLSSPAVTIPHTATLPPRVPGSVPIALHVNDHEMETIPTGTQPLPIVPSSFSGVTDAQFGTPRFHRNHRLDVPFMSPAVSNSPQTRWFGSELSGPARQADDAPLTGAKNDGVFVLHTMCQHHQVMVEVERVLTDIGANWSGEGGGGTVLFARFDPEGSQPLHMRVEIKGVETGVSLSVMLESGDRSVFVELCRRLLHLLQI